MTAWLKQSTAVTVKIGPFLDDTDGKTAETALTISQADVRLSKNGGDTAQKGDATACTHDELGYYDCPLSTTDTGTLGVLLLMVHEGGALPVWHQFMVVPANVWDSLFGADKLQVDAQEIAGAAVSASTAQLGVNVVNWKGSGAADMTGDAYARLGAPAGASVSADLADIEGKVDDLEGRVVGTIAAGTHQPQSGDAFARLGAPAGASVSADVAAVKGQTAAIETDTQDLQTQVGTAGAGLTALPWNAAWDAEVQSECSDALNAYDPPTKAEMDTAVANVSVDEIQATALADLFNTDSGTTYSSAVAGSLVKEIADNAGGASLTAADVADAVWDETAADHSAAGSTGAALAAAGSAGDPWSTALPGAYGAGTAGKIIGDNLNAPVATVDTVVDAIKAKTDNLPGDPADQSSVEAAITAATSPLATSAEMAALNNLSIADIIAGISEGSLDLQEMLRIMLAGLAGLASGGGTGTVRFRNQADTKDRIVATVDANGNRTAIAVDGS